MKSESFDRETKIKKPVKRQKKPNGTRHFIDDAIDDFGEDLVEPDLEPEEENGEETVPSE